MAIVPGRGVLSLSLSLSHVTSRVINLATSSRAYGNSFSSVLFSVVKLFSSKQPKQRKIYEV